MILYGFVNCVSFVIDTLKVNSNVQFQHVSQKFLRVANQKMHGSYARQRADNSGYGDVIVNSLYDNLGEPGPVPSSQNEGTDELILCGRQHLILSPRLSQCTWEKSKKGEKTRFIVATNSRSRASRLGIYLSSLRFQL